MQLLLYCCISQNPQKSIKPKFSSLHLYCVQLSNFYAQFPQEQSPGSISLKVLFDSYVTL